MPELGRGFPFLEFPVRCAQEKSNDLKALDCFFRIRCIYSVHPTEEKGVSVQAPILTKFGFRIKTRVGVVVENLMIHGRSVADAERKLRQMYRDCEVLECICHRGGVRTPPASFEDVANLITR